MASKKRSPKARIVRKQSARGWKDRTAVALAIPRNPCVRHLHLVGKPGSGKAVPILLLIG